MEIKDKIFGDIKIDENIIIDLINSPDFQRLKGISQFGIPDELYHIEGFNRFEHSIGVFFILRNLGASMEEQVAGLLHDVSHASFSHIVDWVYGFEKTESYQDNFHNEFIEKSDISKILNEYGYSSKNISNLSEFKLLDRHIPEMCVDRFEYAIRELPKNKTSNYLNGVYAYNNYLIFDNVGIAKDFAEGFVGIQKNHWGGFESMIRYRLFSDALKEIVDADILKQNDFWDKTESEIIEIMRSSKNNRVLKTLDLLENNKNLEFLQNKNGINLQKKFRYVDPLVKNGDKLVCLSEIDNDFVELIKKEKENNKLGININLDSIQ